MDIEFNVIEYNNIFTLNSNFSNIKKTIVVDIIEDDTLDIIYFLFICYILKFKIQNPKKISFIITDNLKSKSILINRPIINIKDKKLNIKYIQCIDFINSININYNSMVVFKNNI